MERSAPCNDSGNSGGTGAVCRDRASASKFVAPDMCSSQCSRYVLSAWSRANSLARALSSFDLAPPFANPRHSWVV